MDTFLLKNKVAKYVIDKIPPCDIIGVGSGSTVNLFLKHLIEYQEGVKIVTASSGSSIVAQRHGFCELTIPSLSSGGLDICVDGADLILSHNPSVVIKGHGGALFQEKLLWNMAKEVFVLADTSKMATILDKSVPIEIVPPSLSLVENACKEIEGIISWEIKKSGSMPFITDNGNYILNLRVEEMPELETMHKKLKSVLGVVETGIFLPPLTSKMRIYLATADGVEMIKPP